jgi:N-acetylmuramoyl-L-alanine amidase
MKLFKRSLNSFVVVVALVSALLFTFQTKASAVTILKEGVTGTQVVALQNQLKALGYFSNNNATGYFGTVTENSVMKFQNDNNLIVDGVAGPKTLGKVNQLLNPGSIFLYTVQPGDSLWTLSLKFGTDAEQIKALNGLSSVYIYIGQILKVNGADQSMAASASITESQNADLYWLSRIIEAEASSESYTGKVAVGNVIINRKNSSDFPNTIKGVIFDYYQGIAQFSPVADGTIYNTPSNDSINAALDALSGVRPVGSATYFFNPDKAAAAWIVNNKTFVERIGNHVFYE